MSPICCSDAISLKGTQMKKKKTHSPEEKEDFSGWEAAGRAQTHACSSPVQPGRATQMSTVTHPAVWVTRQVTQLSSWLLPCLFRMLERWLDCVPCRARAGMLKGKGRHVGKGRQGFLQHVRPVTVQACLVSSV